MPPIKCVCVVGAGISGLTAIKNLREYGFEVICYEKGEHIGGLWRYNTDNRKGFGSVMRNTILNTSKEFVTLSDFPMNETKPNFMPNQEMFQYFEDYAEHFDLRRFIEFGTEVLKIERSPDYEATGNWLVTTKRNKEVTVNEFTAVMVCNGHHVNPVTPKIEGLETFKGTKIHSHDYTDHTRFIDRKVLVVGFGNSGGDVACELARVAKQVHVSTRHGTWVTRRVVDNGYPRDAILRTRFYEKAQSLLPSCISSYLSLREYTSFLDHSLYGLRPTENPGESPVLLADDLPLHLSSGFIKIRKGISKISENVVYFTDGSLEQVDDIVFCTGYEFSFDFIENGSIIPCNDNQVDLWKRMFAPDEQHHSLAIIGLVDPMGPTMTTCEMQSRAVAHMWANNLKFPNKEKMKHEIDAEKKITQRRFKCSARKASLQIPFISYMDDLAEIIGCQPNVSKELLFKDPKLAFMLLCGPVTASHYRLNGPGSWENARKQILGTFTRVHRAMQPYNSNPPGTPYTLLLLNTPVVFMLCSLLFFALILAAIF